MCVVRDGKNSMSRYMACISRHTDERVSFLVLYNFCPLHDVTAPHLESRPLVWRVGSDHKVESDEVTDSQNRSAHLQLFRLRLVSPNVSNWEPPPEGGGSQL